MSFYVCWLLADETEAEAIRLTAASGDRLMLHWPHLATRAVDAMDVNKLERLLLPRRKGVRTPAAGGKLLSSGKRTVFPFTCVSRVEPSFVRGLAALTEPDLAGLAERWSQHLGNVGVATVVELLRRLSTFARQADQAGKPVLQLDIL
jgi:hypothetical protein